MQNMGYVRWQNTREALRECAEHLSDDLHDDLEIRARVRLIEDAREMVAEWDALRLRAAAAHHKHIREGRA